MDWVAQREAEQAIRQLSVFGRWRVRLGRKIYLGHETRPGWRGSLPFYLFWCPACRQYTKDYPHGYVKNQYLICSGCGTRLGFVPLRIHFRKFYELILLSLKR